MIIPAPTIPGIWRRIIHRTAGASRKLRTKAITTGRKKSRAKYKLYNVKSKKMPVSAMDRTSTGPRKTSWKNVLMSGRESSVWESCGRTMVRSRAARIVMSFLGVYSGSFKKLSACQVGEKLSAARMQSITQERPTLTLRKSVTRYRQSQGRYCRYFSISPRLRLKVSPSMRE